LLTAAASDGEEKSGSQSSESELHWEGTSAAIERRSLHECNARAAANVRLFHPKSRAFQHARGGLPHARMGNWGRPPGPPIWRGSSVGASFWRTIFRQPLPQVGFARHRSNVTWMGPIFGNDARVAPMENACGEKCRSSKGERR
jgi:hypothetical protein